ncbi:hypothetical protein RhiirA4_396318 [Rhizophagus irregularis]|uniref:Uncharacterized protein n=1 Tax=Rhizophagus irregularis TaxID=588596 RepID=A0A2I1G4W0_9GLOM|nr:hypothetical protein RhiirA4_396318 [Rhizophagus irregularis]
MVISDNIVEIQSKIKPKKTKHNNYLQQAFKLGIIKKNSTVKYKNVIVEVSVLDEHAALLYENHPYFSFYKFMLAFNKHARYSKLIIDEIPYYNFRKELKIKEKTSRMYTIPLSISSTTPRIKLHDEPTSDRFDHEIMKYFIGYGFEQSLVRSFMDREAHLDIKTNSEIMFDFLEERQYIDPTIFIGVEGNSGVASGEDKSLLMKWGLTEKAASELRNSVIDDTLWCKQILYHWLFEWILNPWGSFSQMSGPQMFASSYDDIAAKIDEILSNNTKVSNVNSTNSTRRAYFHATNQQSAQSISKNGIKLGYSKHSLDFGFNPSFYLNPDIGNAIDWIKPRKGFNGIVIYWVDVEKIQSMKYRNLVTEGDDVWKKVVVASRCAQKSEVDKDDFVYGYQLSNPRQIRSEWEDHRREVEFSWQNVIPNTRWFEPIQHLQLAVKTPDAVELMDSYCIGVIYFHTDQGNNIY